MDLSSKYITVCDQLLTIGSLLRPPQLAHFHDGLNHRLCLTQRLIKEMT